MEKVIEICCGGKIALWENRQMAIDFFREGVECCEGSERDRYVNILSDLYAGKFVCVDEQYLEDKRREYTRCANNNSYHHFDNPHNTRDYNGILHNFVD